VQNGEDNLNGVQRNHQIMSELEVHKMSTNPNNADFDLTYLRVSAIVLFLGELLFGVAGYLHPAHEPANNHPAVFAEYASSTNWTLVHLGQFAGMLVIIAGLLILYRALNIRSGLVGILAQGAAVSAVVTLSIYGILQAIDGVALKQVVDAWASAPEAEKAARFASAEAIRFLEWGGRSYQDFMLGITFVLFAMVIVLTARIPRLLGLLVGLTGIGYIVQGFVVGAEGFSANNSTPTLFAYFVWIAWSIWLLIFAWRRQASKEAYRPEYSSSAQSIR
jgi:hypothetical protein